ncbi:hypothetical protein ACHAXA_008643, partial [Cyclostephanos tholiformis]
ATSFHIATGLTVTLYGIANIEDRSDWEGTTSNFFGGVYDVERPGGIIDVSIVVTATTEVRRIGGGATGAAASGGRRRLQSGGGVGGDDEIAVVVTYDQETWYDNDDPYWVPDDDFLFLPLSTVTRRDEYIGSLKALGGYEDLTNVSEISYASDDGGGGDGTDDNDVDGFWTTGAIIGIAVGGSVALLIAIVAGVVRYNSDRYNDRNDRVIDGDRVPSEVTDHRSSGRQHQDSRTWNSFSSSGVGPMAGLSTSSPSLNESSSYYENRTVGTTDYDYAAAYGGMGGDGDAAGWSLSDAGGTLGSRTTRLTGADDAMREEDAPLTTTIPNSGNTVFSEDPTFDQVYEDIREIIIDVYAPAGKLGVVIDTPNDSAPTIHAVKETSPIVDKVRVGDKLVAVDDEDVRAMTAMKVSKLISKKGNNPSRKLTIIRHESGEGQAQATRTTPTGGVQSSMSSMSSPGKRDARHRSHRRDGSIDEEVDAFLLRSTSSPPSSSGDDAGPSSSLLHHPAPAPDPSMPAIARCRALASMRAWGDMLRVSNDALHGRDVAGDARGVGACYAELLTTVAVASPPSSSSSATGTTSSSSSSSSSSASIFSVTDADGPQRDACELISLRFVAQTRLRRHADVAKDVAALGLLMPCPPPPPGRRTPAAACNDGLPPWVPFGLRIFAAHQLQYGDGSSDATDALYALRDRAVRTEYWNTAGMEIWRATIDNTLVNAHIRKREWRLALWSLDELIGGLEFGVKREVEWWCSQLGSEEISASDAERSRMGDIITAAARVELLSRQLLILLQSGAISAADAIQEDVRRHATEFHSLSSIPPPPPNTTALVRMIRESALTRQVPVRRWINEGLLLFARNKYTEAATCFRDALNQQRQLDLIVFSPTLQSHPAGCPMWKDLTSPTLGFDAAPSLTVECLNNLSLCHLYSGNMQLAVQELEGLIREDPCLYLTEAVAFNLCTLYELGLDGEECARKKQLLHRVAKRFHLHDVSVESFRLG